MNESYDNTLPLDQIRAHKYTKYRKVLAKFMAAADQIVDEGKHGVFSSELLEEFNKLSLEFIKVQSDLRKVI